jgi:hypothetical protein
MTSTTTTTNKKRLEGVQGTRELGELLEEALQFACKNDGSLSGTTPSFENARSVLLDFDTAGRSTKDNKEGAFTLPIGVIAAMNTVLSNATTFSNEKAKSNQVEQALQKSRTQLVFTSPIWRNNKRNITNEWTVCDFSKKKPNIPNSHPTWARW